MKEVDNIFCWNEMIAFENPLIHASWQEELPFQNFHPTDVLLAWDRKGSYAFPWPLYETGNQLLFNNVPVHWWEHSLLKEFIHLT